MNPYAAPKAKLEEVLPGAVWRDGKLVRMDRNAALPDRCVVCNEHASKRIARTLYWSPVAWRVFSFLAPLVLLFGAFALRIPMMVVLFWLLVIVLGIANYLVRKKLKLDLGVCERHRRLRTLLQMLSIATLVGAVLVFTRLSATGSSMVFLAVAIVSALALAFAQRMLGVQKVSVSKLDSQHAWLAGTGKSFREALPDVAAR